MSFAARKIEKNAYFDNCFGIFCLNSHELQMKVVKKAKIRNRYDQVPHLTQNTIWKSDKNTRKHHIPESEEVRLFPAGDQKAAINRQDMDEDKHESQITRSTALKPQICVVALNFGESRFCFSIFWPGLEVIKLEFIHNLKIKRNDWPGFIFVNSYGCHLQVKR